jgi:hypothetical protein
LSKKYKLYHKVAHGFVDLEFSGKGNEIETLKNKYTSFLNQGMTIEKTAKSAVVRIETKQMILQENFDMQRQAAIDAIKHAQELVRWANDVALER